ncbi:hypothetical protein OQA88_12001 [Cercophora sp. LCS_1]
MRLLNTDSFELEEFTDVQNRPPYAILSHTWRDAEITFGNYVGGQHGSEAGYDKIRGSCTLAASEGFRYIWIDTCCVDQSSSAELSESINSMFEFYHKAAVCYAYLSDVQSSEDLEKSRWFTRGWTLQELIAPSEVVFLSADWTEIGTKHSLCDVVSRITRIDERVLRDGDWSGYTVAQKMSWAAGRRTTRLEDEAYCIMGLFDVNMPLLYGEGRKAFIRLQQEILKATNDQSLFAWACDNPDLPRLETSGLMAKTPDVFKCASHVRPLDPETDHESVFEVVNQLVRITLPVVQEIKGLKLRLLTTTPPTHQILEIQSDQVASGDRLVKRGASADSQIWGERPRTSSAPEKRPQIVIEVEDDDSRTLVHRPDASDDPAPSTEMLPNPCGCLEGPPG